MAISARLRRKRACAMRGRAAYAQPSSRACRHAVGDHCSASARYTGAAKMASLIQKAAIFGAAGTIGPYVAQELERRCIPFRVVGRNKARLQQTFGALK